MCIRDRRECGAAGSASGQTACPVCPTLRQSRSRHSHASPLCPGASLCPSYPSGCLFLFYLLGVGLPCHSIFCQFWLCEEAQCVYLRRHLGSPKKVMFSIFEENPYYFTQLLHQSVFLPTVHEDSLFFHPCQHLLFIYLLMITFRQAWGVMSLYFSDDYWHWTSLYMSVGHLSVLWRMTQVLWPFC